FDPAREVPKHARADEAIDIVEPNARARIDDSLVDELEVVEEHERLGRALGRHDVVGVDRDGVVGLQVARVDAEPARLPGDDRGKGGLRAHASSVVVTGVRVRCLGQSCLRVRGNGSDLQSTAGSSAPPGRTARWCVVTEARPTASSATTAAITPGTTKPGFP